ncbi:hypothetical protein Rmf_34170 [Roseomonas fluvialis]|uniref:Uncharacterized protein n=1 Tax=Roseomonas fluvialis TaxID=1750527 RepID=A0ABM7Y6D0_9PROT|nr:hypothetical protein Rmf_34170 [Roseomonas fluvialis]
MIARAEARNTLGVKYSDHFNIVTVQDSVCQEPRDAFGIAMEHRPTARCDVYQMDELLFEHGARQHQEYRRQDTEQYERCLQGRMLNTDRHCHASRCEQRDEHTGRRSQQADQPQFIFSDPVCCGNQ